jgi:hypothetical protein
MENNLSGDRVVTLLTLTHQQSVFGFGRSGTKAIGLDWHPGHKGRPIGLSIDKKSCLVPVIFSDFSCISFMSLLQVQFGPTKLTHGWLSKVVFNVQVISLRALVMIARGYRCAGKCLPILMRIMEQTSWNKGLIVTQPSAIIFGRR